MTIIIFQKIAQTNEDIRENKNMSSEISSSKKRRMISSTSSLDSSSSSPSSDGEQQSKKKKKKHKKRKSKKRHRTKSPTPETSQFRIVNQKDQSSGNFHLNHFIQEKDLKESILKTVSVASNLQEVRRMDEFMAHLLKRREMTESFTSSRRYL